MASLTKDDFVNQAFGNIAGARVPYRYSIYRIRSHATEEDTSYDAEEDTLFADFEPLWDNGTFGDFDDFWDGFTFGEFDLIPLWNGTEW